MKKIDLKLVITDEDGKDKILSLFIPVMDNEEITTSNDLLNTVSEFISCNLLNANKNIADTSGLLDYYISKNKVKPNGIKSETREQKDIADKSNYSFSANNYFKCLLGEEAEQDRIVNIVELTISDADRSKINRFMQPLKPVRYDLLLNKSLKEYTLDKRCISEDLHKLSEEAKTFIIKNSSLTRLSRIEMVENDLYATEYDAHTLYNYVIRRSTCDNVDYDMSTAYKHGNMGHYYPYTYSRADEEELENMFNHNFTRRNLRYRMPEEVNMPVENISTIKLNHENMNTAGKEILIYKRENDRLAKYTNNDLYIMVHSEHKDIYKIDKIGKDICFYISTAHNLSSWENVYITREALDHIRLNLKLTDKQFKSKIFSYSSVGESLPTKIVNLREHQKQDIKDAKKNSSNSKTSVCEPTNTIEIDINHIVYFLRMSEYFDGTLISSQIPIKELLDKHKLDDLVYVKGYTTDDGIKKAVILKDNFPILIDGNKFLNLTAEKIKIKNTLEQSERKEVNK